MSGLLLHGQDRILQQLLLDLNQVGDGEQNEAWPCYYGFLPDEPTEAVCVYGTEGRTQGKTQFDGETQEFPGFQIRVRSDSQDNGAAKAKAIATALDGVRYQTVEVGTSEYKIWGVHRSGSVLSIGPEAPNSLRRSWTINGVFSVRMLEIGTGS